MLVLIVMVLGILLYFLPINPKVNEVGRLMIGCALLAICFTFHDLSRLLR